ncbi:hypothetical protein AAMO2058_001149700 [Amorphochlora amoebiformis]
MLRALSTEYDARNNRRERIYRIARELTIRSKKMIFLLHRGNPTPQLMKSAQKAREELHGLIGDIYDALIDKDDYWRMLNKFSFGLQEFVEAVSFFHYIKTKRIIAKQEIENDINQQIHPPTPHASHPNTPASHANTTPQTSSKAPQPQVDCTIMEKPGGVASIGEESGRHGKEDSKVSGGERKSRHTWKFELSYQDYLLGIADITGELMRLGTTAAGLGDREKPLEVLQVIRTLYSSLLSVNLRHREWKKKMEVMFASMRKMEQLSYKLAIKGKEYPPHMLKAMLASARDPERV